MCGDGSWWHIDMARDRDGTHTHAVRPDRRRTRRILGGYQHKRRMYWHIDAHIKKNVYSRLLRTTVSQCRSVADTVQTLWHSPCVCACIQCMSRGYAVTR